MLLLRGSLNSSLISGILCGLLISISIKGTIICSILFQPLGRIHQLLVLQETRHYTPTGPIINGKILDALFSLFPDGITGMQLMEISSLMNQAFHGLILVHSGME